MILETDIRIDKYLWAVRLYKTRSQAAEACKNGRITINGMSLKPSRTIKTGDIFDMRDNPIVRRFRVKNVLQNRVGAKLVPDYLEDITPPEELEKLFITKNLIFVKRDHGTGRPTKKERRDLENFSVPVENEEDVDE